MTRGHRQGSVSSAELRGLERAPKRGPWRGFVFLVLLIVAILVGGAVLVGPRFRDAAYDLAKTNPQIMRMPLVPDIVRDRLGDRLEAPAGDRAIPQRFTVAAGQGVADIARALQDQGLVLEPLAFSYLAVTQGVEDKLHTGSFNLDPTMTPQVLQTTLRHSHAVWNLSQFISDTTQLFTPPRLAASHLSLQERDSCQRHFSIRL